MLLKKIKKDLIEFLKTGEKIKISVTRLLLAAIKDKEISQRKEIVNDQEIKDSEILEIINKMIKQREVSAKTYLDGGRKDLADKELMEAEILSFYLPEKLSEEEVEKIINITIKEIKANSIRDMGNVIQVIKEKYAGRCDFQKVSKGVREKLSNIKK